MAYTYQNNNNTHRNLRDLEDDSLLTHNGKHNSKSSDSHSFSSLSSLSSFNEVKAASKAQEETIFRNEREIREGIKQVVCGRINLQDFREILFNLSIVETNAMRKYFREVQNGAMFSYAKLIKALSNFDLTDYDPQSPQKRVISNGNPIPTMDDFYSTPQPTTPSKRFNSSNFFSKEFTQTPPINTPGKKQAPQSRLEPAPLPSLTPPPFEKSSIETAPPAEIYNQLIRAYISKSITDKEFLSLLTEKTSIVPSDTLLKIVRSMEMGKRVTYAELAKEITLIAQNTVHISTNIPKPARSAFSASMDIYDPSTAPEEKYTPVPHSLEQHPSKRGQRDVLTWEIGEEDAYTPGKKLGPRNNRVATDLLTWGDEVKENVGKKKIGEQHMQSPSADSLFSWSSDDLTEVRGKKAFNPTFQSSIPWGTDVEDRDEEVNPHFPHITKKMNTTRYYE